MPSGDAYSSGHLFLFHLGFAYVLIVETSDKLNNTLPGLTSGLQGSVNVHRGATMTVNQFFCILHYISS